MPVSWEICHPSIVVLLYLLLLNSSAGGLMVFSAVSMVSSSEVDNDMILLALGKTPPPPKKKPTQLDAALRLIGAVRSKVKREKSYTQLIEVIHPVRNGLVPCSQHSYFRTFPFKEGVGRVLAVKVFRVTVLLAEQHQKRSYLAGASNCFWTQGTDYDL